MEYRAELWSGPGENAIQIAEKMIDAASDVDAFTQAEEWRGTFSPAYSVELNRMHDNKFIASFRDCQ